MQYAAQSRISKFGALQLLTHKLDKACSIFCSILQLLYDQKQLDEEFLQACMSFQLMEKFKELERERGIGWERKEEDKRPISSKIFI